MKGFSLKFKVLVVVLAVIIVAGLLVATYTTQEHVKALEARVSALETKPTLTPVPTVAPTASPTASLKRLPTREVTVSPTETK